MIGRPVGWTRSFRRLSTETATVQKRSNPVLLPSPPTTTSGSRSDTSPSLFTTPNDATMLNIANRTATARRSVQRVTAGMATSARIGDTKVPMSLLEPGWYINYQRIEDNLVIVRDRCVVIRDSLSFAHAPLIILKVKTPSYFVREDPLRSFGRPTPSRHHPWCQLPQIAPRRESRLLPDQSGFSTDVTRVAFQRVACQDATAQVSSFASKFKVLLMPCSRSNSPPRWLSYSSCPLEWIALPSPLPFTVTT